jgi:hypothetical protein
MNVKELIEALGQYPEDTMVVVHGYEGEYGESGSVDGVLLKFTANTVWYHEKYEEADKDTENPVKAVIIS